MKIAHIAPVWYAVPPKDYGGTEGVIANLIEEQVARGEDVTLIGSGDSKTSAKLVSFIPESLVASGNPWQAHVKPFYHYAKSLEYVKSQKFDVIHLHLSSNSDMYFIPLVAQLQRPFVCTLHSPFPYDGCGIGWTGDADHYYQEWLIKIPMVAISENFKKDVPFPLNFVGVVHHGLPNNCFIDDIQPTQYYVLWI
eukprot:TRINITY_DN25679_c0_g1_i1.p1 TRINITY_DN25679_c0_g1~~TRINITY_DN25679_c0_g1_i1.p1  ORF type:complete len:195 (-),score=33.47 TRINITY_DN25679_c0_g1_i1:41-625(-)